MKVLLLDRDPDRRTLYAEVLASRGHAVQQFDDLQRAADACTYDAFQLLLLCWPALPEVLMLCRRLRALPRGDRSVILLAAAPSADTTDALLAAGADEYLPSPTDDVSLGTRLTIAEHLARERAARRVDRPTQGPTSVSAWTIAPDDLARQPALHDMPTGLPTQALLADRLAHAIIAALRHTAPLALFLIEIDRFQEIAATFAERAGTPLLAALGARLQSTLRNSDTVARMDDDRLALLLLDADAAGSVSVARKVLAALEAPFEVEEQRLELTGSIGIALYPADGSDADLLLRHADAALYIATRAGGGYAHYSGAHDQRRPSHLTLLDALRQALANHEFQLHYQPQVDLLDNHIPTLEALLRWPRAAHGTLPTDYLVSLAEQDGATVPLTRWVLETALRQLRQWLAQGPAPGVSVNLSPRALLDPHLADLVAHLVREYDIAPGLLTLEITERCLLAEPKAALEVLERLSALGARIVLEEYGTGYSSLAYLAHMPLHGIKIDTSFMQALPADERGIAIVRSTIDLGHHLRVPVVAEGVETAELVETVRQLGCDQAQGSAISPPLSAADVPAWLANR